MHDAVFDASLIDFARVSPSGAAEGMAIDCAGAERGIVLAAEAPGKTTLLEVVLGEPRVATDLTRALVPVAVAAGSTHGLDGVPIADAGLVRARALGLAITVADLVGIDGRRARRPRASTRREREQYGVAIGSFQAVQHLLAEARASSKGRSASRTTRPGRSTRCRPMRRWRPGAVAKAYCARAARTVCETAIQVHGGIGNTWECFVHVYLRRALFSSARCSATRVTNSVRWPRPDWGTTNGL